MKKKKDFIDIVDEHIYTSIVVADFISPPDALAVAFAKHLLTSCREYHEKSIRKRFNKTLSRKLENIEKFLEILSKAITPK